MSRFSIVLLTLLAVVVIATPPCQAQVMWITPSGRLAQGMTLEGTWKIQVWWGEFLAIQYLQTFSRDGKTTLFLPTGGPVNEGDKRIACTGEWRSAGPHSFDVTMYCLRTQEWEAIPNRIRAKLTLDKGGETFTECPFVYETLLPDGEVDPAMSGPGEMSGDRLPFVPLD